MSIWTIDDFVKDLKHVVTVLCETRGHAGRRPCEFCSYLHLWKVREWERAALAQPTPGKEQE